MANDTIRATPGNDYASFLRVSNFRFQVTIDNVEIGFDKVTGLENTHDVIEYREGNETEIMHKLPGLTKTGSITLERAMIANGGEPNGYYFKTWDELILDAIKGTGNLAFRKNIKIATFNRATWVAGAAQTTATGLWIVYNAWPTKVSWSDLDGGGNDLVRETVELAVEHIKRIQ
jgi:phage tail-like protein